MFDLSVSTIDMLLMSDFIYKQHILPTPRNLAALEKVMAARGRGVSVLLRDPLSSAGGYVRTMRNSPARPGPATYTGDAARKRAEVLKRRADALARRNGSGHGARTRPQKLPRGARGARGGAQDECRDWSRRCNLFRAACADGFGDKSSSAVGKRMYVEYNCRETCGFCQPAPENAAGGSGGAAPQQPQQRRRLAAPRGQYAPAWEGSRQISVCRLANTLASLIMWNEGWAAFAEAHPSTVAVINYVDIAGSAGTDAAGDNCDAYERAARVMGMDKCAQAVAHNASAARASGGGTCHVQLEAARYTGDHSNTSVALAAAAREAASGRSQE